MNQELKLKKCPKCHALIEVLQESQKDEFYCCNTKMEDVIINDQEASYEKHIPNYTIKDDKIIIKINHVMEKDHYIQMIAIQTKNELYKKYLTKEDAPEVIFQYNGSATIYSYCNKHGLWKIKVEEKQNG